MKQIWGKEEHCITVLLVVMGLFDTLLLTIDGYFALSNLKNIEFGLINAIVGEKRISFQEILQDCEYGDYCEFIKDFEKSGKILQIVLIFDAFLIALVGIQSFGLNYIMKKYIAQKEMGKTAKIFMQILSFGTNLLVLHPVLVNLGFLLWINYSKFSKLSDVIVLKEGMILLIIQCFFSLLGLAFTIWMSSKIKRRNLRLLRSKSHHKQENSI